MPVIELDMLIAYVNSLDKLHGIATKIFNKIVKGDLKNIAVPVSAYLEYNLVLRSRGYREEEICTDIESFRGIRGLGEIPLTSEILVASASLRIKYGLTFFDSLHAASALLYDGVIISVDKAYQRIRGLEVLDPRTV